MFKLTFLYRRKVNKKCNRSSVQVEKSIGLQMSATQHYGVMVWLSNRVFQNSPKFSFFKIISIEREVNLNEQSSICIMRIKIFQITTILFSLL